MLTGFTIHDDICETNWSPFLSGISLWMMNDLSFIIPRKDATVQYSKRMRRWPPSSQISRGYEHHRGSQ